MAEFGEQLPISKPKLEFIVNQQGMISMKISGNFWGMYQIAVGYNGTPLAVVPFTGLGVPMPPYPKPSLLAWILSDQSGMWGRRCPICGTYFRTNHVMENTACPYCANVASSLSFLTEAQGKYVTAFCNAFIEATNTKATVTIDLDAVTDSKPEWTYAEERQQFHFKCKNCQVEADILGEYGWCPKCGKSNSREIIEGKLKQLDESFEKADKSITNRAERDQQWEEMNSKCFSLFEALGRHLQTVLVMFPAVPSRKKEVQNLSFQRLMEASESLEQWYGIKIFENTSPDDKSFVNLMLNKRHIIEHNGGKVDEKYLKQSGDTKAKLHQRIGIANSNIRHLLPLIRKMAFNLLDGFESVK